MAKRFQFLSVGWLKSCVNTEQTFRLRKRAMTWWNDDILKSKRWAWTGSGDMLCNFYPHWCFPNGATPITSHLTISFFKNKKLNIVKSDSCVIQYFNLPLKHCNFKGKLCDLKWLGWHRNFFICKWKFRSLLTYSLFRRY